MIAEFVKLWNKKKDILLQKYKEHHPNDYIEIVTDVVKLLCKENEKYDCPDPERVHQIDDGDYQGTLVFIIGAKGYHPDDYWYVKVDYGSCSVCDTLKGISQYDNDPPSLEQANEYLTLALHILQNLKKMGD